MKVYNYEEAPFQPQPDGSANKVQHTDSMSLVTWRFSKGYKGAKHAHPQEQVAYVLQGRMQFTTDAGSVVVKAGNHVVFAGNEAHESLALEDSVILDIFSGVRQDFVEKFSAMQPVQTL